VVIVKVQKIAPHYVFPSSCTDPCGWAAHYQRRFIGYIAGGIVVQVSATATDVT
jgi:hypothetical protein